MLVVIAVLLGFVQVVSDVLARRAAQPASLVHLLPARVDDRLLVLRPQRLLAAREALADGDATLAQREIASLGPSRDRSALEGRLAESRGDLHGAAREYERADDYESLERIVTQADRAGDHAWAMQLQRSLLTSLQGDRTHLDAFAEACWELGYLDAEAALGGRDVRAAGRSLSAYERAHALAPFNQKYVLSAAYQALALHDLDRAAALFTSSLDADPTSLHAIVGLGDVALLRGHRGRALSYLQRARRIDAASPDVAQLAHRLGE